MSNENWVFWEEGLEALNEQFKNSEFPSEAEHCLPVAISPPRNGRRLTEPLPISGRQRLFVMCHTSAPQATALHSLKKSKPSFKLSSPHEES